MKIVTGKDILKFISEFSIKKMVPMLYGLEGGNCDGEICGRNGCQGTIVENPGEGGCSCHICPPCGYCVNMQYNCDTCDWNSEDEDKYYESLKKPEPVKQLDDKPDFWKMLTDERNQKFIDFNRNYRNPLYKAKNIEWMVQSVGYASMVKFGMMPEGTPVNDIVKEVKGTFGGRFKRLTKDRFEYVAYTD